tara:strand:+ start:262 stop:363 length:102 start_codon:yes stop_codon:yes gene_type:complete
MDVTSFLPSMMSCEALLQAELHTREQRKKKGSK